MRKKVLLICQQCSMRNYTFFKKKDVKEYLVINKFCPSCRKHTKHYESR